MLNALEALSHSILKQPFEVENIFVPILKRRKLLYHFSDKNNKVFNR